MSKIAEGNKIATIVAARFIKSKTGTMGMEIMFEFTEGTGESSTRERLNYVAWLSPKAIEHSMDMLVAVLKYNGSKEINKDGVLSDPNALTKDQVQLVVEMQEYTNDEGVTRIHPKIKWVNCIGKSAYESMDNNSIQAGLISCSFEAAFLAAKAGDQQQGPAQTSQSTNSMQQQQQTQPQQQNFNTLTADDIPF